MLRTIFAVGFFALAGMFALGFAFHLFGALLGLAFFLVGLAIKVAIAGAIVYLIIRIVSPETARRLRQRFSGSDV
ncbi:MAG TPA: hypothetical protein VNW46_20470 [Gemmatimonadaceae bacterium]|jgi:hypothetical protein|nr:hypothetical protein [Gemmatimonadaceae bacterium]